MVYITFDFGSSNSGAVLNAQGKEYNPAELIYVHEQYGNKNYLKQETVFWIKRDLIEKSSISDDDINVFSCVFYDKELYFNNANFIWCRNQIKETISELAKNKEWVRIQYPKMELYKLGNNSPAKTRIRANDGTYFPFVRILKIFFHVVKKECLHRASEAGWVFTEEEINWGITVPGLAIWNQEAVSVIKEVAHTVFGDKVTLLSEPESALIGVGLLENAKLDFVKGRYSMVVDLGGGTADICVMQETLNSDGTTTFDEIKSTEGNKDPTTSERSGGNDIDMAFISFFCWYLANETGIDDSVSLYSRFLLDDPRGAMDFEDHWRDLKFSDDIHKPTVYFSPGRAYNDWLKTHCQTAAKKISEYGDFQLDGEELRKKVFNPIYDNIIKSIKENLRVLKNKNISLDVIYFAGGLSLDKELKKLIKSLSVEFYPYVKFVETSTGSVSGAVQRGGNHISVNKETLIRRMARKTFYVQFANDFNGKENDLRADFKARIRSDYYERFGIWLSDSEIEQILNDQWKNKIINYSNGSVHFYSPLCLRFAPVTQVQSINICPLRPGKQTEVAIKVFSSDKNFMLFKNDDITEVGGFEYDFGYNWDTAKLVFDPISNAVEGTALFYLADENGKKLKEFVINNVSKRGF